MVRRFLAAAGGAAALLLLAAPAAATAAAGGSARQSSAADIDRGADDNTEAEGGAEDDSGAAERPTDADENLDGGADGGAEGRAPPAAPAGPEPAPACTPDRGYRPPVAAPVTDPFRPPAHPFGPGNRGLEYATPAGTPVRAIGPGTVVFAGPVAGQLHVTVRHADGLRSTYSYLGRLAVATAEPVARGQVVGWAGPRLHLGVRCGTAYLDPARLFGGRWRARLVPDSRFPGAPAPVPVGPTRSPPPP